jgi:hypothetical protein
MWILRSIRTAHWGWPGRCNKHSASSFYISGAIFRTVQHGLSISSLIYSRLLFPINLITGRDIFISSFISFFLCYFCFQFLSPFFSVNALRKLSTSGSRARKHKSFEEYNQLNIFAWCDSQDCIFVYPCCPLFGHFIHREQIWKKFT